jgi:hypothetical protein
MSIFGFFLAWTLSLATQDPKDPQDVLQEFGSEIQKAIRTAPKDPSTRDKLTRAAKVAFDQDLRTAVVKVPKARWDYHYQLMEHLVTAEKKYTDENVKTERGLWITACKLVFNFECIHAKDPDQAPTTEEAFEELWTAAGKVRKDFPSENGADLRKVSYLSSKQVFNDRLKVARHPPKDPQSCYAEELIKIDKFYPLPTVAPPATGSSVGGSSGKGGGGKGGSKGGGGSAPPEKKEVDYNTEANGMLKQAAKAAFDRAMATPK